MAQLILKGAVWLLLLGGTMLICDGIWLRAKAVVAQVLLQTAWRETRQTGAAVKPWPWADSWPVAQLTVPRLGVNHIVLAGSSGEVLAFGPGHLSDSAAPGRPGNCVLVGHRDTSFAFLRQLRQGDVVTIEVVDGRRYDFAVTATEIAEQDALYLQQPPTPWLTLITCYPFDALATGGSQRYVVFARLTTVG